MYVQLYFAAHIPPFGAKSEDDYREKADGNMDLFRVHPTSEPFFAGHYAIENQSGESKKGSSEVSIILEYDLVTRRLWRTRYPGQA